MALPSLDSVPMAFFKANDETTQLEMPNEVQLWLCNLIDTLNEALLQIDARLTAGGL